MNRFEVRGLKLEVRGLKFDSDPDSYRDIGTADKYLRVAVCCF